MNGLEVSHLSKSYGDVTVVDDLSFCVGAGEIFGLIGPNGAGKSTTIAMIIGLLKPDAGTITFNGKDYNPQNPDERSRFGFVPQELAIYPELTAIQNLNFFGKLQGLKGRQLQERVDLVLDLTGLRSSAGQTPSTFSGGMSRRLNFGISLLHEPRFVVLDEPTVGIDPQSRTNLLDAVRQLSRQGVGVLYASHYMEEIEGLCDRVAIIDQGRLLRQGSLDELLDRARIDLRLTVGTLPPDLEEKMRDMAEVNSGAGGQLSLAVREARAGCDPSRPGRLRAVLDLLDDAHVPLLGIEAREISLETLFLKLTGRTLRD